MIRYYEIINVENIWIMRYCFIIILIYSLLMPAMAFYQFNITPENINQQSFSIDIQTTQSENEIKYRIIFSQKTDIPLPTNFTGIIIIAKGGRKISNFKITPVYETNRVVFTVSLRKDYVPYAKARFLYYINDTTAPRGIRSVSYNIMLAPFTPSHPENDILKIKSTKEEVNNDEKEIK